MRRFFGRIDAAWQAVEAFVIALALATILILGGSQIILRNFADAGWIWADGFIRHLVLVVGLLGGSLAAAHGRHITIDALSRLLKGRWLHSAQVLTAIFAAAISILLFLAAVDFVRMERLAGGSLLNGWLPTWIIQMVIPYTFGSVAIRIAAKIFSGARSANEPEEEA